MKDTIRIMTALFCCLALSEAQGVKLTAGSWELGVQGNLETDTPAGTDVSLELRTGYFVADGIEGGLLLQVADNDDISRLGMGLLGELNFDVGSPVIPFAGASLSYQNAELSLGPKNSNKDAGVLGLFTGAKYFLVENVALSAQAELDLATSDIYPDNNGAQSTKFSLSLGLRFFF